MRIASHNASDTIVQQLQLLNSQQTKLQNQVGTGLRITQPEDDPAAMVRVLSLNSENTAIAQFVTNADRALEVSQATYSGLQHLKKISDRATEIGTLGLGAQSSDALSAYAAELDQLIEQAVQLGNSQLGNDRLFAGTAVDTVPYTVTRDSQGAIASATYVGNTAQCAIPLSETASVIPASDSATNQGIADFLNHLVSLRDALNTGNTTAMNTAQTGLLTTENVLVSAIARQGAVQMRIEVSREQQTERTQNIGQLISSETSADLTSTVVKLSQAQTAYQAALQSASMIMQKSLLDYIN